jgi:hypothetical protein
MNALWVSNTLAGKVTYRAFCEPRSLHRSLPSPPAQRADVLAESYALVEDGAITEADFKAWTFENPYKLYTEANPNFFKGTAIEAKLAGKRSTQAA